MTTKQSYPRVFKEMHKFVKQFAYEKGLPAKLTRHTCFMWIERELGGLNPTDEQAKKTLALATQLSGDHKAAVAVEHCNRLDIILDQLTEKLCPEEWAAHMKPKDTYQRANSEVFRMIYGGDPQSFRDEQIMSQLGGVKPLRDLV